MFVAINPKSILLLNCMVLLSYIFIHTCTKYCEGVMGHPITNCPWTNVLRSIVLKIKYSNDKMSLINFVLALENFGLYFKGTLYSWDILFQGLGVPEYLSRTGCCGTSHHPISIAQELATAHNAKVLTGLKNYAYVLLSFNNTNT